MAASGTTKKVTLNNLLACSPTATLASLNVTGSSIPANGLYLPTTNTLEFSANSLAHYRSAPLGVFSWYDGAGGTRMTLNATGLGVGVSPSYKLDVAGIVRIGGSVNPSMRLETGTNTGFIDYNNTRLALHAGSLPIDFVAGNTVKMTLDTSGNVGVGGSPVASKVEVYSSNTGTSGLAEANALKVENNNATVGNAAGLFLSQSGTAGCGVAAIATSRTGGSRTSDLALYYYNQSTSSSPIEGIRLNSSGNVGIGQTPSDKLNVRVSPASGAFAGMTVNDSTNVIGLMITGSAYNSFGVGANSGWLYAGTNNMSIGPYGAGYVSIVSSGAERIRFAADGNAYMTLQGTVPTIPNNAQMVFNLTSNTNLRISVKGSDGTTRTANITLA
jgi:hypothetical protein